MINQDNLITGWKGVAEVIIFAEFSFGLKKRYQSVLVQLLIPTIS